MVNYLSTSKPKNHLKIVRSAFEGVISSYLTFLDDIAFTIEQGHTEDVYKEKLKLRANQEEFFKFLLQHRKFYKLKTIYLKTYDGSVLFSMKINYRDTCERFMKIDDLLMLYTEYYSSDAEPEIHYEIDQTENKVIKKLKDAKVKLAVSKKGVLKFLDNNFLVDKNNLQTNCSSYKELQADIDSRFKRYQRETLNIRNIKDATHGVLHSYFRYLQYIANVIYIRFTKDIKEEKRKFFAVKKEFFEYLLRHKKYFRLKTINLKSHEGFVLFTININYENTCENFLKLEDVSKTNECNDNSQQDPVVSFSAPLEVEEVIEKLKAAEGKFPLSKAKLINFLNKNFLVDRENLKTNCLSYKELQDDIDSRLDELEKETLNNFIIHYPIDDVIESYFYFLRDIAHVADKGLTDDVKREKRKFCAVQKELFEYLLEHKKYVRLKTINLQSKDGLVLFTININYQDTCENFLKLEDVSKMNELQDNTKLDLTFNPIIEHEFNKTLKVIQRKCTITNEHIPQFFANNYLVDKDNIKSKFANYKHLQTYIYNRNNSYLNRKVSIEQINQLSFKLNKLTGKIVDEKFCGICYNDYEKDQEVCQLPCNHLCCRNCTVKMFAIPQDGSNANFQCPYCRDDCT